MPSEQQDNNLFHKLHALQQEISAALDQQPEDSYLLAQYNRLTVAKETLRHLSGTSEHSLEVVMTGGLEIWKWNKWNGKNEEEKCS
jgi:hypothetical protein